MWESDQRGITMNDKLIALYASAMAFIKADRDEEGATAVEYGLLVALIAAVIVAIVATLGEQIQAGFTTVSEEIAGN